MPPQIQWLLNNTHLLTDFCRLKVRLSRARLFAQGLTRLKSKCPSAVSSSGTWRALPSSFLLLAEFSSLQLQTELPIPLISVSQVTLSSLRLPTLLLYSVFKPELNLLCASKLRLSTTSQRKVPAFKDSCDQIWPTWIIYLCQGQLCHAS